MVKSLLPDCGLYRTSKPLPGHEDAVPAGVLVYFHNHSDSGLPVVVIPEHNIHNRWHFHGPGIAFRGLTWADSLTKLPPEGYYMLRKSLSFEGGEWPKASLVQLGYTKSGDPILFIAQVRARLEENDLFFSDRGLNPARDKLSLLEPLQIYAEPATADSHMPGVH
jgi:hypothetical protein